MYRIGEVVVDAVSKTDHVPPPAGGRQPKPQGRGEYSRTLERLARFTLRHKLAVVGAWIAAAAALAILFPQLEAVVREQSLDPLPSDVASFQSLDRMGEAFDEKGATNSVFVTMENPAGLSETVRDRYETMVDRLRSDSEHVLSVRDLVGDPRTARQATSADGQAWYLPVGVAGTIGGTTSTLAIEAVREIAREAFDGTGTSVHVTGPPATFSDQITTAEADLTVITLATIALIVTILLIVYRSVFTALLPLIVVGMSLAVGRGLLSWFGQSGFPLSQFTIAFMTAILLGAGVDYSVFFISRFHERLRQGMDPDDAIVDAAASIGRVILASAATVALAFLAMLLAKLSAFASVGPACAVAVVVGFAATVTLLPPLLSTAARRGIGLPRTELTRKYWNRVGVLVIRRPVPLFAVSMVALLALSAVAATMQVTYDDRAGQPAESDSNLGYALLDSHFPRDTVIAEFLLIQSPRDMRTARGLADLEQMATRVAQMPGVTRVVGITRPTGSRLEQAELPWQNARIGDEVQKSVDAGNSRRGQLETLAGGADQLADALALLDRQISEGLAPLAPLLTQVQSTGSALSQYEPLLSVLADNAPAIDNLMRTSNSLRSAAESVDNAITALAPVVPQLDMPWCDAVPTCVQLRTRASDLVRTHRSGLFTDMARLGDDLQSADTPVSEVVGRLQSAANSLNQTVGSIPADLSGQLTQLQSGVHQLAEGAGLLADGVRSLVDSNLDMLGGMSQLATQLRAASRDVGGTDSAVGFYLPPNAFDDDRFAYAAQQFVSPDGKTVRFIVQTSSDPYSADAMRLSERIQGVAESALPNTTLDAAEVSMAGFPAINSDLQELMTRDFWVLALATLLIVGLILMALLRALVAPLYLLMTVVLNYAATLGVGVVFFQYILGESIHWTVPLLAFIVLVAVGADYNMLLVSRLREESITSTRVSVLRTIVKTGSVITSAGIIFAGSMFGLMAGSVSTLVQAGFIIGMGLLLDTFVVRTIVVPLIAAKLGTVNWWPRRPHQCAPHRQQATSPVGAAPAGDVRRV
ncbi:RND family transporter [Gordonia amicalis]|uniref:MMPL/RND family transporter n=1 Tax=Gordonia amicalis TaxID=89053 RepID=UPI0029557575|nr:RND family transporter [Gordonia amicalis]MDV7173264.1 RND family transporter [Gordonia amicalis]